MSSVRHSMPAHRKPGTTGEPVSRGLADRDANYRGAMSYDERRRREGAECAARIVENAPALSSRRKIAEKIRRECG